MIEPDGAWRRCEAAAIAAVGALNVATVATVDVIADLIASEGWRRRDELPSCWALFAERLTHLFSWN